MSAVAFDHRDAGTSEAEWSETVARVPVISGPARGDHLVVLAAHPDDETLGAGGLIAAASAAGARVTVVVAADGEASHPASPSHSREQLAALRRREVGAAIAALAPDAEVRLLGLPDGRLADWTDELAVSVESASGQCTHLVTPWSGDRHPDHEACAGVGARLATRLGAQHWQYPIWAWHWAHAGTSDLPWDLLRAVRLDAAARTAKSAAIGCHVSQHRPLSPAPGDEPVLGAQLLAHFDRDAEIFVVESAGTVSPAYFDGLYAHDPDPWGLRERFYEQRKRALLLAALTRPRFRRAFEPGCAGGLLTAELARRCDEVIAWDLAAGALERAGRALGDAPNVTVAAGAIPDEWPSGTFDLVVLSEVGYYCADLDALTARVDGSLSDDGVLVACHWRHAAPMHPHTAANVHAALGAARRLVVDHVEADFLLQVWSRDGTSVAVAEGIVA